MTLTVQISEKCSQIIKMNEQSVLNHKGSRKSTQEINDMCKDIAHDISKGNYLTFKIS